MPKRSSTKKAKPAKRDFSQIAFDIVAQATGQAPKPTREDVSVALNDEDLRKQVMREMGSRGGKKGGAARAASMTPEKRAEVAQKAAAARWKNKG